MTEKEQKYSANLFLVENALVIMILYNTWQLGSVTYEISFWKLQMDCAPGKVIVRHWYYSTIKLLVLLDTNKSTPIVYIKAIQEEGKDYFNFDKKNVVYLCLLWFIFL